MTTSFEPALLAQPRGVTRAPVTASVYLHPGQLFASADPVVVSTILGSCVAVCLYDPERRIGGINHFLLPHEPRADAERLRYGPAAIRELLARTLRLGARRERIVGKIFGGANVLGAFGGGEQHLGAQNVRAARASLEAEAIPVAAGDVGGSRARKLMLALADGTAWVRIV